MENKSDLVKEPVAGTVEAGNTIYRVFVQDIPGQAVGDYTATTGPNHPLGAGRNLLFGSGLPGTSFNTFRSYTTMTDYTVDGFSAAEPPFAKVSIRQFATTEPLGDTGVRTTYVLPGPPVTPDALTIVQDVNVIGTTFEDSYIEVRVHITNNNNVNTRIGIRYLWDPIINSDDGPTFQTVNPISPLITNEAEFDQPGFEAFQVADNDNNPNPPTYIVYGTVTGPGNIGIVTPPTRIQYAYWPTSRATTFDYTIDPNRNISIPPNNDSAVLYYWGHNKNTAITLEANGGSFIAAAALFATKPGIVPPFINSHICIMANRIFDVCRQEVADTKILIIPSLESGKLLGCEVKQAQCFVCQIDDIENSSNTVQVQVALKIEYTINTKCECKVTRVVKPFAFTRTAQLSIPENATVSCVVQSPTCESTQLETDLVETTVHAFIQLMSVVTEPIVIPYVASCPVGLCPPSTTVGEEQDANNSSSEKAADGNADDNIERQ
jgi:hypothetical protein